MSKKPSQIVQVKVRMREDLRRRIEHAAEKNGLTVNAEILRRLDQTFDVTLDKLEGSVATLTSRFEEFAAKRDELLKEFVRVRAEKAIRDEMQHLLTERGLTEADRKELQRRLTETEKIERREELQRRLTEIERELQRLTEAGEKDQGD